MIVSKLETKNTQRGNFMKKCFTMLLSVGLAGICAIGIAACGGGSSVKNIVSDIVTQEEWEAAFAEENFENFKLEATCNLTQEWLGSATVQCKYIIVCENEKIYQKTEYIGRANDGSVLYGPRVVERYYDPSNGLEYVKDENNQWVLSDNYDNLVEFIEGPIGSKSEVLSNFLNRTIYIQFGNFYGDDIDFADSFDLFEYSEEEKGYLYEYRGQDENGHEVSRYILKFKKGKFAGYYTSVDSLEYDVSTGDYDYEQADLLTKSYIDSVVTYGGQHVTLPEVSEAE